jgi:lipoprotein NlpI
MTRKSVALYYFTTNEKMLPRKIATNYQARPQDGARSVLIYLDKKLVAGYTAVKGALGINDDFTSKMLNLFSRKKKK